MNPLRDTIFIGHATPDDNDKALWLYYKLKNEGYKVECDLSYLLGGESDYWNKLQRILEDNTCKYILVYTITTFEKQGVLDEWEHCKNIARKNSISDFIIPVKFDDVDYAARIGLNRINIIDFNKSWAVGLKRLLRKLSNDSIPKTGNKNLSLNLWYRNKFSTETKLLKKQEKFYSNWLEIPELPDTLHFYQFINDAQAKALLVENPTYPIIQLDNFLITFSEKINLFSDKHNLLIEPKTTFVFDSYEATRKYESETFPKYKEAQNFLKRLLKDGIHKLLLSKNLGYQELSNDVKCFYYKKEQLENDKVFFEYDGKKTWKQLVGEYRGVYWHYGVSFKPSLYPFIGYYVKAHILFSDDGFTIWDNPKKTHKYRRGKGKSMYNPHWRNQMLAFLHSITSDDDLINIKFSENFTSDIKPSTVEFFSDFGYEDPKNNARLIPIDDYDEDEIFLSLDDEEINDENYDEEE